MSPNWKHRARQGALLLFALGLVTPIYKEAVDQLVNWRIAGLTNPTEVVPIVVTLYAWSNLGWFGFGVLGVAGVWALTTAPDTPPDRKRLRWAARLSSLAGLLALSGIGALPALVGPEEVFGTANPRLVRHVMSGSFATAATLLVLAYLWALAGRLKRPRLAVLSLVGALLCLIAEAGTLTALVVDPYGFGRTFTDLQMPKFFGIPRDLVVSLTRWAVSLMAAVIELVVLWRIRAALDEQRATEG